MGLIPRFKSRDDLLEEEFDKFIADHVPPGPCGASVVAVKMYFKAYVTRRATLGDMIDKRPVREPLRRNPWILHSQNYLAVPDVYRKLVPE